MLLKIDNGLLRAAWDFFVLFSGVSTASNLSRTQRRPVRRRGLFLYRPSAPTKPNDPPGKSDLPASPPVGPASHPELAKRTSAQDFVVRLPIMRILGGPDQGPAPPFAPVASVRSEIRFSADQNHPTSQIQTPAPSFWRGPREAAAAPQVPSAQGL